jgi:hypothetical protein
MGVLQVEKPKRIKVGNGPACLVGTVPFVSLSMLIEGKAAIIEQET